jgi:hypothetical protein
MQNMSVLTEQKVAVVGTGGSAQKYLNSANQQGRFDYYNSSGTGSFNGQIVRPLTELNIDHYDRILIAIYRYDEVLYLIDRIDSIPVYWFNGLDGTVELLDDVFRDNTSDVITFDNRLAVIYDLRVSPPTYDFLVYLVRCKLEANRRAMTSISVIVCPGDNYGFRHDIDFFSVEEMNFRIVNLFLPLVKLVDPTAAFYLCNSRFEAREMFKNAKHRFPIDHNFHTPVARHFYYELFEFLAQSVPLAILRASDFYKNKVLDWAIARRLVLANTIVITLRESGAHNSRNSNISEWYKVSSELINTGYDVIILRDTDKALEPLYWEGTHQFSEASLSVNLRLALYELSRVNLAVSNGAHALCSLSVCRYILFGMLDDTCSATTAEHLHKIGMFKGCEQRVGAGEGQYLSWGQPTSANILKSLYGYFEKGLL